MAMRIGFASACAWLALAASASAAPTWLAPKDISDPTESITFPEVAVNAAGNAVAIWPRDTGSETIVEAIERPAGGDWSEPVVLSDPTEEEEPATTQVALDTAGNAVAVWSAFDSGFVIRTAVRPAGGDWSEPDDLFVEGLTPHLAMNAAGDAVAVWAGFDGVDDYVTWAAVRPAGGDWSEPEELSVVDENDGFYPQVAIDAAGNAIAVWQRFDLSDNVIQAAVRPAGGDWSEPDEFSAVGEHARAPRIAMNAAGAAVAAWTLLGGGVQAAVRPPGGDWSSPDDVSATGESTGEAALAIDSNGSAFAIWPTSAGERQVLRVAMLPPGGDWSEPDDLSARADNFQSYALEPNAAVGVVATWTREDGTIYEVQATVRPPGGDWSEPDDLSTEGEDSGLPEMGFDAAGNAVAIWGRAAGEDYVLQGAGYDFSGPRLDALQIPVAGTAGEPVSFSVSPFDVFSLGATNWTFGDGGQANGNAVSHVYSAPGKYPVAVSAFDASGNATTQAASIEIGPGPVKPPPPRPRRPIELSLRIERESLQKLVRTGTLRVAASVNEAANVALSGRARLKVGKQGGARTRFVPVFEPKTVRFDGAAEEKVTLDLSKRGRRTLRSLSQVKLLIAGEARDDAGGAATKTVARTLR